MNLVFPREINRDLEEVQNSFRENLSPWWNNISVYYHQLQDDLTWNTLPAVVLSVYKYFDLNQHLAVAMACSFKTVYFSNSIHALVKDDDEGQEHDQTLQFTILVGDYIFGTVLKSLVRSGTTSLVGLMSDMMCELNEGMVLKHKMGSDPRTVLEKTRAPLYGTAFLSAARLAGVSNDNLENYRQMGRNLGMALEVWGDTNLSKEAKSYIHNTEVLMGRCKNYAGKPATILENIIRDLHLTICSRGKAAVV
jgi:hypothetical protein